MKMKKKGFIKSEEGKRIDNIPDTGKQTGNYSIDYYGCWWEYIRDSDYQTQWIIGNYPKDYKC